MHMQNQCPEWSDPIIVNLCGYFTNLKPEVVCKEVVKFNKDSFGCTEEVYTLHGNFAWRRYTNDCRIYFKGVRDIAKSVQFINSILLLPVVDVDLNLIIISMQIDSFVDVNMASNHERSIHGLRIMNGTCNVHSRTEENSSVIIFDVTGWPRNLVTLSVTGQIIMRFSWSKEQAPDYTTTEDKITHAMQRTRALGKQLSDQIKQTKPSCSMARFTGVYYDQKDS